MNRVIFGVLVSISSVNAQDLPLTHIGDKACTEYVETHAISNHAFCLNYSETPTAQGIYQCTICGCGTFKPNDPGLLEDRKICVNVLSQSKLLNLLKNR